MEMRMQNPKKKPQSSAATLLFCSRRMMCSKQLLLRKTACRTGRSSQLSMAGMASTTPHPPGQQKPLSAPSATPNPPPNLPKPFVFTQHLHPQGDEASGWHPRGRVGVEHLEVAVQKRAQGHGAGAAGVQRVHRRHHAAQRQLQQPRARRRPRAPSPEHPQEHLQRRRRDGSQSVGLWGASRFLFYPYFFFFSPCQGKSPRLSQPPAMRAALRVSP